MTKPASGLNELAKEKGVRFVSTDEPMGAASTSPPSVPSGLNLSYPELASLAYDGAGIGVVVLDSGYKGHSDIKDNTTYKESLIAGNSDIIDRYGHGNHVAAIIAGTGEKSNGYYAGVAPGAHLVSLRVLDDAGTGIRAVGARLTARQHEAIRASGAVRRLYDNHRVETAARPARTIGTANEGSTSEPATESNPEVETTAVPVVIGADLLHDQGITGAGVVVALLDTGVSEWSELTYKRKHYRGSGRRTMRCWIRRS